MHDLRAISTLFDMRADFVHAEPYGSGHINDTYRADYQVAGRPIRFIHQRINHRVFENPVALMENIERVTRHALNRLRDQNDPEAHRRTLTCIPSIDGDSWARDADGNYWRTYPFIEGALGYEQVESLTQASEAAKAFARFQKLTADLDGERLHETIPHFHHTGKRLEALRAAVDQADPERLEPAMNEVEFALVRESDCLRLVQLIEAGSLPERVTHSDTKLNNVLLDTRTQEGVCVIDLDTTMPGTVLSDFGDMVRTICPTTREDEADLSQIDIRIDRLEALTKGYLSEAIDFLEAIEIEQLAFSGKLLTLECGIRYLTDFLEGDRYFKTRRPGHNLDRCRSQFALVRSIESRLPEMEDLILGIAAESVSKHQETATKP